MRSWSAAREGQPARRRGDGGRGGGGAGGGGGGGDNEEGWLSLGLDGGGERMVRELVCYHTTTISRDTVVEMAGPRTEG